VLGRPGWLWVRQTLPQAAWRAKSASALSRSRKTRRCRWALRAQPRGGDSDGAHDHLVLIGDRRLWRPGARGRGLPAGSVLRSLARARSQLSPAVATTTAAGTLRGMTHYRIYQLDASDAITAGCFVGCGADTDALRTAGRLLERGSAAAVELWQAGWRISRLGRAGPGRGCAATGRPGLHLPSTAARRHNRSRRAQRGVAWSNPRRGVSAVPAPTCERSALLKTRCRDCPKRAVERHGR
jgi:hypothetical protein